MTSMQWLERAEREGTPFIEDGRATFVWFGKHAPTLMGDFNWWGIGGQPFPQMTQTAPYVWTYSLALPPRSYIQYAYTADIDDPSARLIDPFNRQPVANGFGRFNNSFATPDYPTTCLTEGSSLLAGTLGKYQIRHTHLLIGGKRDVWLYEPPTDDPVPLIVAFDGQDAIHNGLLAQLVDTLILQGRIRPVALACIAHADSHRIPEYDMSEALLGVLLDSVLPLARRTLRLVDEPGAHAVMGQSMGGLMALYTALRLPHIFGTVISQSGAYQVPVDAEPVQMLPRMLWTQAAPLRIWMDVGRYEWLFLKNEVIQAELSQAGHDVTYRVYNSGHNWVAWHSILCEALTTLYGE